MIGSVGALDAEVADFENTGYNITLCLGLNTSIGSLSYRFSVSFRFLSHHDYYCMVWDLDPYTWKLYLWAQIVCSFYDW